MATPVRRWSASPACWRSAAAADRPVFVHPGPVRRRSAIPTDAVRRLVGRRRRLPEPAAGRLVVLARGRPAHRSRPADLLRRRAGLAPVHHERYLARGGRPLVVDPGTFVDTSSYSRQGVDSLVRVLGVDPIVLGSDRPYGAPAATDLGDAAAPGVHAPPTRSDSWKEHAHDHRRTISTGAPPQRRRPGASGLRGRRVRRRIRLPPRSAPAARSTSAHLPRTGSRVQVAGTTSRPAPTPPRSAGMPCGSTASRHSDARHPARSRPRPAGAPRASLVGIARRSRTRSQQHVAFSDDQRHYVEPAPRHPRRRLAAVLDAAERHRLARPRHLLRSGRGRAGPADRAQPGDRHRQRRDRDRRRHRLQLRPGPHPPADRARPRAASPCTPTRRRCGGWGSTRSAPAGVLRRRSVSYADELRPLDDIA